MRHGGLFPDTKLRLFRRGVTLVQEGIGPHGTPSTANTKASSSIISSTTATPDFAMYLDHMNEYSTGTTAPMAHTYRNAPQAQLLLQSLLNPIFGFNKNYFFRLGFLDGPEGLIFHLNHAVYVHWKFIKLWESRTKPKT